VSSTRADSTTGDCSTSVEEAPARAPASAAREGAPPDARAGNGIDRRGFLVSLGLAAATVVAGSGSAAAAENAPEPYGILIDTTRCAGCRSCEVACAEANGLPAPNLDDETVFDKPRHTSETQFTVVNRHQTSQGEVFAKRQCMHCVRPGCASACLTKAILKTRGGPVVWREDKCMGCRFCMISCPFQSAKFEYDSPVPKIMKCEMCAGRLKKGEKPACVENCPAEALAFGPRRELLDEARRRIAESPDVYVHQIYGENEVGGTSVLYLAAVPFEELGFRTDLGETPYPELTAGFLYAVPVVLTVLPPALLAISRAMQPKEETATEIRHEPRESESPVRA